MYGLVQWCFNFISNDVISSSTACDPYLSAPALQMLPSKSELVSLLTTVDLLKLLRISPSLSVNRNYSAVDRNCNKEEKLPPLMSIITYWLIYMLKESEARGPRCSA